MTQQEGVAGREMSPFPATLPPSSLHLWEPDAFSGVSPDTQVAGVQPHVCKATAIDTSNQGLKGAGTPL